tara:strand:+ start:286 stop:495 length:210 start_codon:yes stop_codon:yes gene_type:complete
MTKININGVVRDMTSAEETEIADAHTKAIADRKIRTDAKEVKATKKASGKQKLKDLGLDDDEIKALTGA